MLWGHQRATIARRRLTSRFQGSSIAIAATERSKTCRSNRASRANVKAGHYREARKVLEAALETQPGNPEIINTLALQRQTIIAERTGGGCRLPFLQRDLALYEQHKAAREGWPADDPGFHPRSPATQLAKSP